MRLLPAYVWNNQPNLSTDKGTVRQKQVHLREKNPVWLCWVKDSAETKWDTARHGGAGQPAEENTQSIAAEELHMAVKPCVLYR